MVTSIILAFSLTSKSFEPSSEIIYQCIIWHKLNQMKTYKSYGAGLVVRRVYSVGYGAKYILVYNISIIDYRESIGG